MSYTTQIVDQETGAPVAGRLYTPYECAKVVNAQLEELGRPAGLPPQMFYNYVRQGTLSVIVVQDAKGKPQKLIKEDDLAAWFLGYIERKDQLAAKALAKITKA